METMKCKKCLEDFEYKITSMNVPVGRIGNIYTVHTVVKKMG